MKNVMIVLIAAFSLTLSSCAKKSEKRKIGQVRDARGVVSQTTQPISNINAQAKSGLGLIGNPGDPTRFNERVKELVSASFDPSQLGNVSADGSVDSTKELLKGVWFKGRIVVPKAFCESTRTTSKEPVDVAKSKVEIAIFDDNIGKSVTDEEGKETSITDPVRITFDKASSGEIWIENSTVYFMVTFNDGLGEVMFWGSLNDNDGNAEGYVYFTNAKSFNGEAPNTTRATLGAMVIPTSSFISCQ